MNRLLLDEELKNTLPRLYEQDKSEIKILHARFYHPIYNCEWFAMEYSSLQKLFFGLFTGIGKLEYGYFTLDELDRIEAIRDYRFKPILIKTKDYYRVA
jgi:hypothetical protein